MWSLVIIFGVISIIFFSGKGGFLIAGYNTSSKEEKKKYNEKKLCMVMGCLSTFITILLVIQLIFSHRISAFFTWFFPISVTTGVIITLILCNTICRNKDSENNEPNNDNIKSPKLLITIVIGAVLLVGINIGILMMSGNISVTTDKTKINIAGYSWKDLSINFKDITSVELKSDINIGSKSSGFNNSKLNEGKYKNQAFGEYTLYSYTSCHDFIILTTNSDKIVLNLKDEKSTKELYELILQNTD